MARYLALAPAFVPRSYLLRVLGVLMLLAGGLLPYFLLEIGDGKHPPDWFSQYMAVTVLFGTASSGGAVLRRIRSWTPSILVTGMWRDVCLLIGAGLVLLW
ncbi:MAG TPA: hypothetical protein VJ998_03965, partial [Pseudomonadales bacterium]|nr:hypothetical protein [Pseudomonadales bacterium]